MLITEEFIISTKFENELDELIDKSTLLDEDDEGDLHEDFDEELFKKNLRDYLITLIHQ